MATHIHISTLFIYSIAVLFVGFILFRLLIRRRKQKEAEEKLQFFINTVNTLQPPLLQIKQTLKQLEEEEPLTRQGKLRLAQTQSGIALLLKLTNELMNFEWIALHADNSDERAFIARVREQIELHINDPAFNVDALCTTLHMSRTSFYNKIKELTDRAPGDYIRLVRLKRASQLLKEQRYSVTEVAEMTGFNDAKYFREVFKKHFGVSPREYGRKMSSS